MGPGMELFPPMPLEAWRDTKETLHRFCQVVGKLRLAASVRRNHWWNVPLHLTGRGTTDIFVSRHNGGARGTARGSPERGLREALAAPGRPRRGAAPQNRRWVTGFGGGG